MTDFSTALTLKAWRELGGGDALPALLSFTGEGALPSAYAVTDTAAASVAVAGLALAELVGGAPVTVDRRLASMWFAWSLRTIGWERPNPWDPTAGDYKTADGWIKLHTNFKSHKAAVTAVLGELIDRANVEKLVAPWKAEDLEAAISKAGGVSAEMRSADDWSAHPQGRAVEAEPLADIDLFPQTEPWAWRPGPADRPLKGLKVLDLTRVLAGPVATRFLAGYGADVLRIDPIGWDESGIIPEVSLGKRCARLDLKSPEGKAALRKLIAEADLMMHGYRPGALAKLGFGPEERRALNPDLVDVSLCAYGWTGPWNGRRGYDSLVQLSAGIADKGMAWASADKPVSLPVQALDHACGYFLAASAIIGVHHRALGEGGRASRLSLARTATFLKEAGTNPEQPPLAPETPDDIAPAVEETGWGQARRVKSPLTVGGAPLRWDLPAPQLGTSEPAFA